MSSGETVEVLVVTDRQPNKVTCSNSFTAEELCIVLCKKYNVPPLTRTLFGLRVKGTEFFLKDNCPVLSSKRVYELRIRFKVPRLSHLITLDENTFDYYFQQARNDVNENRIPEIKYPEHKKELLGLGITDMYRSKLEENLTISDVERNYKKYIPKVILRRHGPFPKKYAHDLLPRICATKAHDVNFVKTQYLQQLYLLAPNYLSEEYKDISLINGSEMIPVTVQVAPFHNQQPGIRMLNKLKQEWVHVSAIEELVYLTRSSEHCLEVSRSGTPMFFKFKTEEQLSSFISVCDGYYRLMEKWTFNLSKDDETPSLKQLHMMKCHGPVGGAFAYRKLVEKKDKKHGSYILRQCQDEYNVFFLDVCTQNNTVEIYPVKFKGDCYVFNNAEYPSIEKLVSSYKNPEGRIYLSECVPPTEYGDIDKSQLLLCGKPLKVGYRIDQAQLQEILRDNRSPRCLNIKHIPTINGTEKYGSGGITVTKKGMWRLDDTKIAKTLVVAFKTLQEGKVNDHLKDFIELANKWACVQSSSIVRLYGVTLSSPTAMVLEYIPYGPFDEYLRNNEEKIKSIHLKKVAVSLARALWDLSEAGIVHGHIRCRRLLLVMHDNDKIVVKLSGPSLNAYTNDDIHWLPVELFRNMTLAARSVDGDIWAFGTTLWEIFSYGRSPQHTNPVNTAVCYEMGSRLLRPARCSAEVWSLVRKCWHADPHLRATPQEMMRDMNHLLHAEYIPVHPHYQSIQEYPDESIDSIGQIEDPTISSNRLSRENSDVGSEKLLISQSTPSMNSTVSDQYNPFGKKSTNSLDNISGLEGTLNNDTGCTATTLCVRGASRPESPDEFADGNAPRLMECIYLDKMTYLVTFSRKIGTGNYGHVYAGWMERDSHETMRREVAIKKLRRRDSYSTLLEEFRNEMEIMKSLHHPHIVEIVGYSWDHASEVLIVMEYLEHGALSHYLKAHADRLTTENLIKYTLDIAMGMDLISAKNIVHRDLAARNVLVVNKHHVKISDFGLARVLPKEESTYRIKTERHLPIGWYAPESAVRPYHFSTESDVWSYGVTAWEIFTRASQEVPKFDETNPRERASCFPIPDGCPPEIFCHLMQNCWELDPNRRPKFIDLARHCKRLMTQF